MIARLSTAWNEYAVTTGLVALVALLFAGSRASIFATAAPTDELARELLGNFVFGTPLLTIGFRKLPAPAEPAIAAVAAIGCFYVFGLAAGAVALVAPVVWLLFLRIVRFRILRFAALAALAGAALSLRRDGWSAPVFWWFFCLWLRALAMAFDVPGLGWRGLTARDAIRASLFFAAPACLLSPFALEWIGFSSFTRALDSARTGTTEPRGARLLWLGLGYVALHEFARSLPTVTAAYDPTRLAALSGEGLFHLRAGFTFYVMRVLFYGAIAALAAGGWQLLGVEVRYDSDSPLLSRNLGDFWRRYHNFAWEFLSQRVFYPLAFFAARRAPWYAASFAGAIGVAALYWVAEAMTVIPVRYVPFASVYPWHASFDHTLWAFTFTLASLGFAGATARLAKSRAALALKTAIDVLVTNVLLSWFFYDAFLQLWRHGTNAEFLHAILLP